MDVKNYYEDWINKFGEKEIIEINKKFNYTSSSKLYLIPRGYLLNLIPNINDLRFFLTENAQAIEAATIFPQYQELWRMYKLKHNQNLNIFDVASDSEDVEDVEESPEEINEYLKQSLLSADPFLIKLEVIESQVAETLGITKINADNEYSRQSYYILKELLNTKKDENALKSGSNSLIIGKLEKIENHLTRYSPNYQQTTKPLSLPSQNHLLHIKEWIKKNVLIICLLLIIFFFLLFIK